MSEEIEFDRRATAPAGEIVELSPLVRRVIAGNGGPMTFTGTCSYIVGRGTVAIIDPGPDDPAHIARLLDAVSGETVSHIVVTHTHRDHSPAVPAIKRATGAVVVGCGPHRPARELALGEINPLDSAGDHSYSPDRELREGEAIDGPGWRLKAIETPGHTANHLAFVLPEEETLFSGDHVMAWSTTIVAPPDGSMAAYMASIEKLRGRGERIYRPGHGGPVTEPQRFLRGLVQHRRQREARDPQPPASGRRDDFGDGSGNLSGPSAGPARGGGTLGAGATRRPRRAGRRLLQRSASAARQPLPARLRDTLEPSS